MKYWLLTTEYPPFFGGGIGTYCAITAKMLASKESEVSVFVSDAGVSDITIEKKGTVRIIRFNTSRTGSSDFLGHVTNISYEFAAIVKHFIDKEGPPAIIEAQEYQGIAYYLLQFKHLLYEWCIDIPVIITAHSPSFLYLEFNNVSLYKYPNYWIGEMERFCLQAADHVISPSAYLLTEIEKRFKISNHAISVVPNPYDVPPIEFANDRFEKENQLVFFGKLSAQKGTFKLLEYFSRLWEDGFREPLYLIGGSDIFYHPERKIMADVVKDNYSKYIQSGLLILENKVAPSEMIGRLTKAKLVIIPSTVDNLPYVVLEMMALGKIVLVSKQGGQAEVVDDGINGFIFDHEQPADFKLQLQRILSLSATAKQKISDQAILTIQKRYNADTVYAQKAAIIAQCKAGNSGSKNIFPFIRPLTKKIRPATVKKSENELLSIVIPYYNMGRFIEETMSSLARVAHIKKEIILVNDGSTDELSLQKLEHYRNVPGISIVDTENRGLAKARNTGASVARGDFIAFLDADDTVHDDYYDKAIRVLKGYDNVHFVGCWTKYFEGSQKTWPTLTPEPPLILYHNLVNSSALVYKRISFLEGGLNDAGMPFTGLEDYDSVISMLANGFNGVVLPEVLFSYRVRVNSMIRDINRSKKLLLSQYIASKYAGFYANFAADLFNLVSANGPGIILDNPTLDHQLTGNLPFGKKYSQRIISMIKKNKRVRAFAYKLYRLINK